MRNEIGSEFWQIPTNGNNNLFSSSTKWFISGRSALKAIIKENTFRTVAVPDWCCDSMIKPFIEDGIKVVFYPALETDKPLSLNTDATLVIDYFGYNQHNDSRKFSGTIIRDVTHSLFSTRYDDADYYFGSLRKWAGFWTGGFAWGLKNDVLYANSPTDYVSLRQKAMLEKEDYINGKTNDKSYLSLFQKAEELLEGTYILPAAPRDIELAKKLDTELIFKKRRENAKILLDAFSDIAVFPILKGNDCPMFVPILIKNRDELRRHLIQKEIYCPVHWPKSPYHQLTSDVEEFYNEELSLVCDQRYTTNDMLRVVTAIREFMGQER